jgi:hypothetical protein
LVTFPLFLPFVSFPFEAAWCEDVVAVFDVMVGAMVDDVVGG